MLTDKKWTRTFAIVVVSTALVLNGCASGPPEPAPVSAETNVTTAAPSTPALAEQFIKPTSEEQSVRSAMAAYNEYLDVYTTIAANGGHNEELLNDIAPGLINGGYASEFFRTLSQTGSTATGQIKPKLLDAEVSTFTPLSEGVQVPWGQVDLSLCLDSSSFHIVGPDGTNSGKYGPQQMLYTSQVIWYGNRWAVSKDWITNDTITACDAS